jgi:hypothetical protein
VTSIKEARPKVVVVVDVVVVVMAVVMMKRQGKRLGDNLPHIVMPRK